MSTLTTTAQNYTIREAARLSGLPESTLRYYETIGLLKPVSRDASSKHRRYTEADIDLAISVACLQATGMSIDDMRAYLKNRGQGGQTAHEQIALLERQQQRLEEEARHLQLRQRYLTVKIAYWHAAAAGDTAEAEALSVRTRLIGKELKTSKERLAAV